MKVINKPDNIVCLAQIRKKTNNLLMNIGYFSICMDLVFK